MKLDTIQGIVLSAIVGVFLWAGLLLALREVLHLILDLLN